MTVISFLSRPFRSFLPLFKVQMRSCLAHNPIQFFDSVSQSSQCPHIQTSPFIAHNFSTFLPGTVSSVLLQLLHFPLFIFFFCFFSFSFPFLLHATINNSLAQHTHSNTQQQQPTWIQRLQDGSKVSSGLSAYVLSLSSYLLVTHSTYAITHARVTPSDNAQSPCHTGKHATYHGHNTLQDRQDISQLTSLHLRHSLTMLFNQHSTSTGTGCTLMSSQCWDSFKTFLCPRQKLTVWRVHPRALFLCYLFAYRVSHAEASHKESTPTDHPFLTLAFFSSRRWTLATAVITYWHRTDRLSVSDIQHPSRILVTYLIPFSGAHSLCDPNSIDARQGRKICRHQWTMLPPLPRLLEQQERCECFYLHKPTSAMRREKVLCVRGRREHKEHKDTDTLC